MQLYSVRFMDLSAASMNMATFRVSHQISDVLTAFIAMVVLMMEAVSNYEASDFYHIKQRNMSEYSHLHTMIAY